MDWSLALSLVGLVSIITSFAGSLWLGDLLRQTRKRVVRLSRALYEARRLLQGHVNRCHRCQGLGYLLMGPTPPETMSHTVLCPRCGQSKDFLDLSSGL